MTDSSEVTEHDIELEGRIVVCQKRKRPTGVGTDFTPTTQYSFDRGATWHLTQIDAYREAKGSDSLMVRFEEGGEGGEYEAFVLAYLHELGTLQDGERLITTKSGGTLIVLKEQAVLAVKSSTIKDIDLRMEG